MNPQLALQMLFRGDYSGSMYNNNNAVKMKAMINPSIGGIPFAQHQQGSFPPPPLGSQFMGANTAEAGGNLRNPMTNQLTSTGKIADMLSGRTDGKIDQGERTAYNMLADRNHDGNVDKRERIGFNNLLMNDKKTQQKYSMLSNMFNQQMQPNQQLPFDKPLGGFCWEFKNLKEKSLIISGSFLLHKLYFMFQFASY